MAAIQWCLNSRHQTYTLPGMQTSVSHYTYTPADFPTPQLTHLKPSSPLQQQMFSHVTATAVYALSIRASKTDPFRKGTHIRLAPSCQPVLCPSEALSSYLQYHIERRPSPHSPLFRWSSGKPISRQKLLNCIKQLATLAGIDASRYATQFPHRCSNHHGSRRPTRLHH